jgi:NDP-sugar pyrophosphorylase family protein
VLGAIVIVGPEMRSALPGSSAVPLSCVDVLGRSVLGRMVQGFEKAGVGAVTVLVDSSLSGVRESIEDTCPGLPVTWAKDTWNATNEVLAGYQAAGMKTALVARASVYTDLDASQLLEFHKTMGRLVTRVIHENRALEFWIIESERLSGTDDIRTLLMEEAAARYQTSGYLNRLEHPRDLRQLVVDGLASRCAFRPQGLEVRPGVWLDEGAEVHRKARIVAPAFLGRGARIEEQCLVTRCSNIEANSHIDYATVVENSSILSNSYVGIGLDVIHSIVDGSTLLNLKRDVSLKITDRGLVRRLENRKTVTPPSSMFRFEQNDISARRERRDVSGAAENTCSLLF